MVYTKSILLLTDGARPDLYQKLVSEGKLPNIEKYLVRNGSLLKSVTTYPSTSGPAHLPFITGCHAGTCNVPGIRWFDRKEYAKGGLNLRQFRSYCGPESHLMNTDIRENIQTVFEMIPDSANFFSCLNRGVPNHRNKPGMTRIWYSYYAHLTDRWDFIDTMVGEGICKLLKKEGPEFIFGLLPGIDEFSHMSDPFNEYTVKAYQKVDTIIGEICRTLEGKGDLDKTMISIVSDHGLSETNSHFEVSDFLESEGLKTFYYPYVLKRGVEAANMVSGNGMTHIYLRNGSTWDAPMHDEALMEKFGPMIQKIMAKPQVDIMATRNLEGDIVVRSKRGEAKITLGKDKLVLYKVSSEDPFGYESLPEKLSYEESLKLTIDSDYPDAPFLLAQLFESERTGDIVLSAANGSDLRTRFEIHEHKSTHGSLHKDQMLTPFISNLSVDKKFMRTVDVLPTMLKAMGKPIPTYMDGVSLI